MKIIDIHTQKETDGTSNYDREIESESVKSYVENHIDFPLTMDQWISIDRAFGHIWNNKLGLGASFYWDEISAQVFEAIQKEKVLIERKRIEQIVSLMITYIESIGGLLD